MNGRQLAEEAERRGPNLKVVLPAATRRMRLSITADLIRAFS
jgi:hypothetical protein